MFGSNALMWASAIGHTEIAQALLAAGINVNHADVSISPFTPSHVIVEVEGEGRCTLLFTSLYVFSDGIFYPY